MDFEDLANMGAYTIAMAVITMIDSGDTIEKIRESLVDVLVETEHSVPEKLRSELSDVNDEYKGA